MDAAEIRRLRPMLTCYMKRFDDCFTRRQTRAHLRTYVEGQLSDLDEKSCEPITEPAGVSRPLQVGGRSYAGPLA